MVKGERNLRTCGMLEHNKNKARATGIFLPEADQQVKITFESNAQEIHSKETTNKPNEESLNSLNTKTNAKNKVENQGLHMNQEESDAEITKKKQVIDDEKSNTIIRHTTHKKHKLHKLSNKTETKHTSHHDENSKDNPEAENSKENRINLLKSELHVEKPDTAEEDDENREPKLRKRHKRHQEPVDPSKLLDQGIRHGGNAGGKNGTLSDEDSSVSSFENGLLTCYGGQVLLSQEFNASEHCLDVSFLINGQHMQTRHDVVEPGYYYYIFYSDNDFVSNDIHAVFDIYKPTLQYENVTQACINKTECTFSLPLMTSDRVIVEVPTRDGIDDETDDISLLVSTCHPRMGVYIIFPVAVLFLILSCAFV